MRKFFLGNFNKSLKNLSLLISNTILYFSNIILVQVVNEKSEITEVVLIRKDLISEIDQAVQEMEADSE